LFYKEVKKGIKKDQETWNRLDELLQMPRLPACPVGTAGGQG